MALVALMAIGSVVMWLGVPLGLIDLASKLADTPNPSLGPSLVVVIGLPVGMAVVGGGRAPCAASARWTAGAVCWAA